MGTSNNRIILSLFAGLAVLASGLPGEEAGAQDNVKDAIGAPGSVDWTAECGAGAVVPGPNETSQLAPCDPDVEPCFYRTTIPTAEPEFPEAVCNDGSPGVFYIRPGAGDDMDKWVIHLQGGGHCHGPTGCLKRWCGQDGIHGAEKMSSDWDGDGTSNLLPTAKVGGMAGWHVANDFKDWTHVWVYYCSSDKWMGRMSAVAYEPDGKPAFSIHHQGHNILSAVRDMLLQVGAGASWDPDEPEDELEVPVTELEIPNLIEATHVVFTGTSGGAKGAIHNADWFLSALNPETKKYLVLDATLDKPDQVLAAEDVWLDQDVMDGFTNADELYFTARGQTAFDSWTTGYLASINAFTDETCRDVHEAKEPGQPDRLDRCSHVSHLLFHNDRSSGLPLIATPTFVRFDLSDTQSTDGWIGTWTNDAALRLGINGPITTMQDHIRASRATLEILYQDGDTVTGVFGPRCGEHVGLEKNAPYLNHKVPKTDIFGAPVSAGISFHEAVVEWLNIGGAVSPQPIHALDNDIPGGKLSTCP